MDPTTIIGIIGATIILIAFLMNQINRWKNSDLIYDLFNFIGSVFLVTYAYLLNSIPFLILNAIWGLFSLKDVVIKLNSRNKRFK